MDIGFLRMMPNMVLIAPADEDELKLALEFALAENKPVCLRYPRDLVPSDDFDRSACVQPFELGTSVVVKSSPNSVIAIVAYGNVLTEALQAAQLLEQEGIDVDVINARFAAPVDERILSLLSRLKGIITLEDHYLACGFGSALLETVAALPLPPAKPIITLGMPRAFLKHDSRNAQLMQAGINADRIVQTAKEILSSAGNGATIRTPEHRFKKW
jgi:1-deoxy-D-xylulose-5-phosphate synthase